MYYSTSNRENINSIDFQKFGSFATLQEKIKYFLTSILGRNEKLTMMNEMGVNLPISRRQWKRHSALLVYSKHQKII